MKTQRLVGAFCLFLFVVGLTACNNDDNDEVHIDSLAGKWLGTTSYTCFTFYSDKTCEIWSNNPLANSILISSTYAISGDGKYISITNKEFSDQNKKFRILKLNKKDLFLEDVSITGERENHRLKRAETIASN